MQGSIGQLSLQLSMFKSTLHCKHTEGYFIRWHSLKGPHATFITFLHSYSRGVLMHNIGAALNHQISVSIRMGRKQLPAVDKSLYML